VSYLDTYGVKDARREKIFKRLALAGVTILILGLIAYFQFRNYAEEKQVKTFLELLQRADYKTAYSLWGCTDSTPCPHYAFDKFMEDWGPSSPQAKIAEAKLATTKSCDSGIIQFLRFPDNHEVLLWVERADKSIGFAPWPICNPRMKVQ
jgi:hypothetical protein